MRLLWVFILGILPQINASSSGNLWFLSDSHLYIEGKSNVNTFRYTYTSLTKTPSKQLIGNLDTLTKDKQAHPFNLKISAFDSGHSKMNRDFQKLLKAEQYSDIIIEIDGYTILNQEGYPTTLFAEDASDIWVRAFFSIAGTKLQMAFPITIDQKANTLYLSGNLDLNIEDFGLEPPTALLGLIKVNKYITISFLLHLEQSF